MFQPAAHPKTITHYRELGRIVVGSTTVLAGIAIGRCEDGTEVFFTKTSMLEPPDDCPGDRLVRVKNGYHHVVAIGGIVHPQLLSCSADESWVAVSPEPPKPKGRVIRSLVYEADALVDGGKEHLTQFADFLGVTTDPSRRTAIVHYLDTCQSLTPCILRSYASGSPVHAGVFVGQYRDPKDRTRFVFAHWGDDQR